jgi:sterol desaturase/sphingolipid hydroxylase (fatty acid hydroxylase superfamily)
MSSTLHYKLNHSDEPIRLFKSDFLEFFTHITPTAVVIIWTPIILFALYRSFQSVPVGMSGLYIPFAFIVGAFLWTVLEYTLHRFLFHMPPRTPTMEKISYLFHGIHHVQPACKTRLVMPPIVSLPLAVIFGLIYWVVLSALGLSYWFWPVFAGTTIGYLAYDLTHYATHHWPLRWGYLKYLKRYHMKHHYKMDGAYYGVTSPVWDYVFHTIPAEDRRDFSTKEYK